MRPMFGLMNAILMRRCRSRHPEQRRLRRIRRSSAIYGSFGVYAPQDDMFSDTLAEPPRLLLVNLPSRDHVRHGRGRGPEKRRVRRQHATADRAPAVELLLRLEHAFGQFVRTHPARLEDRIAISIARLEPPFRLQ